MQECRHLARLVAARQGPPVSLRRALLKVALQPLAVDPIFNIIRYEHKLNRRINNTKENIKIIEMDHKLHPYPWSRSFTPTELTNEKLELASLIRVKRLRRALISFVKIIKEDIRETRLINQLTHEFHLQGLK